MHRGLPTILSAGALLLVSCPGRLGGPGPLSFTVDLRQAASGVAVVRLEIPAGRGARVTLSSFVQPAALRVSDLVAHQGERAIGVTAEHDARGFGRWVAVALPEEAPLTFEYQVRPGSAEEGKMAGPTGYRFGWLDGRFGLFTGRQVFLLPAEMPPVRQIRIRFLVPDGQEAVAPWRSEPDQNVFVIEGRDAATRLLQAIIGVGSFDASRTADGMFRAYAAGDLPSEIRHEALERALRLEAYLSERLGRPRPFDLILVPKAPDGASIAVAPGPSGAGVSLGPGVPTRWLSIGNTIGSAYLAERLADLSPQDPTRWVLESLPVFLTTCFSEIDGWRSRRAWQEQFHAATGPLRIDLRTRAGPADTLEREWRGALVLGALSKELTQAGLAPLEERLRESLGQGKGLEWERFVRHELPVKIREHLDAWTASAPLPSPRAFPYDQTVRLPSPPPIPPERGPRSADRLDLYLGGRNLGLLEQCGCRSHQTGGMARRATMLRRRLPGRVPALVLEIGDALPFDPDAPLPDRQKEIEADLVLDLMARMGTAASVVGHTELAYGREFLAARAKRLPPGFHLLSANVSAPLLALDPSLEIRRDGILIRILGIVDPSAYTLGRALEFEDAIASFQIDDPADAVSRVLSTRQVRALTIAAGPLGPAAVLAIHEAHPGLSLIVTDVAAPFAFDPALAFERPPQGYSTLAMLGRTLLVVVESGSYGLTRVGLSIAADGTVVGAELEDLDLDERIPDDRGVRAILDAHYGRLGALDGAALPAPIGGRLRAALKDASYAGAGACAACHSDETVQWKSTRHANAFATLLERRRQGVPGCYACHVTAYRQPGGYRSMADLPLRHVQCESCHGPAGRHLADPGPGTIVRTPTASTCRECHTPSHSDMTDENFQEYWSKVVHAPGQAARSGG